MVAIQFTASSYADRRAGNFFSGCKSGDFCTESRMGDACILASSEQLVVQ
jgi:hypothetical protein